MKHKKKCTQTYYLLTLKYSNGVTLAYYTMNKFLYAVNTVERALSELTGDKTARIVEFPDDRTINFLI